MLQEQQERVTFIEKGIKEVPVHIKQLKEKKISKSYLDKRTLRTPQDITVEISYLEDLLPWWKKELEKIKKMDEEEYKRYNKNGVNRVK